MPWQFHAEIERRSPPLALCCTLAFSAAALAQSAAAWVAVAGPPTAKAPASADAQHDPALKDLLGQIISKADCFADHYESEVWYKAMEPRLTRFVPNHSARIEILDHVYCEAKRDPTLELPPDLIMALIEVESRFDAWAVSRAGAVGLMQVMPFWPQQLGVRNQLVRVAPNIRMGCEILRYYLRVEHHDWIRALARYNGSVGRNTYPALVMQRWQSRWRF